MANDLATLDLGEDEEEAAFLPPVIRHCPPAVAQSSYGSAASIDEPASPGTPVYRNLAFANMADLQAAAYDDYDEPTYKGGDFSHIQTRASLGASRGPLKWLASRNSSSSSNLPSPNPPWCRGRPRSLCSRCCIATYLNRSWACSRRIPTSLRRWPSPRRGATPHAPPTSTVTSLTCARIFSVRQSTPRRVARCACIPASISSPQNSRLTGRFASSRSERPTERSARGRRVTLLPRSLRRPERRLCSSRRCTCC